MNTCTPHPEMTKHEHTNLQVGEREAFSRLTAHEANQDVYVMIHHSQLRMKDKHKESALLGVGGVSYLETALVKTHNDDKQVLVHTYCRNIRTLQGLTWKFEVSGMGIFSGTVL